ncbi:MAG: tyrosine-type recombinase/integrase [Rikenellaceae bacterium]|nr:tyrosine-type recombinase/integrase [Rikenellaceae bacterium]
MSRVSIRYKEKTNGMKSVYLQFYPGIRNTKGEIVKYEFLNLEVYSNPKTKEQRLFNKTIEEISESIRCQRYIQIVRRDYNFLGKDNLDGDFLEYFHRNADFHGPKFEAARLHFEEFCDHSCKFKDLSPSLCEKYRFYILHDKHLANCDKSIKHNTASSYFNVFLNIVKLAFKDNIIPDDYTKDVRPIKWNHDINKDYLTVEEIQLLEQMKYDKHPQLPQACLFSIYTGLRRSDILDLKWEHFVRRGNHVYIEKKIVKTEMFVRLPLSRDALRIIGKRKKEGTVFTELTISILNIHVKRWLELANIRKHITFHCFRHTYAMMLTEKGISTNIISSLLCHKKLSSTQVYSKVTTQMVERTIEQIDFKNDNNPKKLNL